MKIAITGGAGFIASHIADAYINLGHEVVIIDSLITGSLDNVNPKARLIEIDINDPSIIDIFMLEKFDIVSHHAAQMNVRLSVSNPRFDANTNIMGAINVYEACAKSKVKKVIFASSGGTIYGEQDYFPADEEQPTRPCSPYGISKLTNEKYLFYYKEIYGLDYVALRYGNVYGVRQNPHGEAGVVAIFISKMLSGEQPIINGDGLITRDYVFIDDVVKANVFALDEAISGIYNIGTGIEINTNSIFFELKKALGSDCEEVHGPAKDGEQRRSVINPNKIFNACGWKPSTNINEGLINTANYYKALAINKSHK